MILQKGHIIFQNTQSTYFTDSKNRKRGALPDKEKDIADIKGLALLVFNKIDVIILDSDLNHNGQHY